MNNLDLLTAITVFVLSVLVGVEVISKVPATLHTPLMSGSNAVHGIVVIGAVLIAAESHTWPGYALAFVAMVFGAMNVVGGYAVTDRMLEMFRTRPAAGDEAATNIAGKESGTKDGTKGGTKSGTKNDKARE